ncbi:MAG: hypothetical protein E3J94_07125 [Desulfobacteraceae bacterium]|nr:MAG: hypothetical protein E3J94_07125 [Desulfobacteraceae bacterium]
MDLNINKYTLEFCKKHYPENNNIGCNAAALALFQILYNNLNLSDSNRIQEDVKKGGSKGKQN